MLNDVLLFDTISTIATDSLMNDQTPSHLHRMTKCYTLYTVRVTTFLHLNQNLNTQYTLKKFRTHKAQMTAASKIKLTVLHSTIYLEFANDASEYILVCCRLWHILAAIQLESQAKFCFFFQVSNVRFHRFPVGKISRNLNTARQSVSR